MRRVYFAAGNDSCQAFDLPGERAQTRAVRGFAGLAAAVMLGLSGGAVAWLAFRGTDVGEAASGSGKIAFVLGRGISVINADGTGLRRVTSPKRNIWDQAIAWSPDGSQLAFVRTDGETCGLPCISTDTIRSDGTGLEALSSQDGLPRWSPDGTLLASIEFFGVNLAGYTTTSLDVVDLLTGKSLDLAPRRGGRTSLLRFGYDIGSYAWSPDGGSLCFTRTVGSHAALVLIHPDGTGLRVLSSQPGVSDCAWAPDGTRLAASDGHRVYAISIADGGVTALTERAGRDAVPQWSPDGAKIAYLRREKASTTSPSDLWTISADGSDPTLIAADVSEASWSADSRALAFITPAAQGKMRAVRPAGLWVSQLDGSAPIMLAPNATELDWQKQHVG
jgi:Tol biopolymer transport system component